MTLTLSLRNVDTLANGGPVQLILDRRGAIIGRSPTVDWSLPDSASFISSRHCEVRFEGGGYMLSDTSTNGTLVNGAPLSGPHRLAEGDVITVGQYEVLVALADGFSAGAQGEPERPSWGGWDSHAGGGNPVASDASGWGKAPAKAAIAGEGPLSVHASQGLASPAPEMPAASGWGSAPPPAADGGSSGWGSAGSGGGSSPWDSIGAPAPPPAEAASGWSSPAGSSPPSSGAADIWGRLEQSNDVDWGRCGFGVAPPQPAADAGLGLAKPADSFPAFSSPTPAPAVSPSSVTQFPSDSAPSAPAPAAPSVSRAATTEGGTATQFANALGLPANTLTQGDDATFAAAAQMLRALVGGMVVMLAARARAKAQMGAQTTVFEFGGNNPLKFARTAEEALAQMLNPPERGFKPAQQAIEEAFLDLQSHQMATLKAMQGALRATLDRFSPKAISQRIEDKGLLGQILPGARDAALWRAYVKEFSGVAEGSDEAFMDVFSKEFRRAYDEEAARNRR